MPSMKSFGKQLSSGDLGLDTLDTDGMDKQVEQYVMRLFARGKAESAGSARGLPGFDAEDDADTVSSGYSGTVHAKNLSELRQLEHEAASGALEAIPSVNRTSAQQEAIDRQKFIDTRKQDELSAARKQRQDEEDRRANPTKYWREDADKQYDVWMSPDSTASQKLDAMKGYNDLWAQSDQLDALAKRVDEARNPGSRIQADDARREAMQRREWENTLLNYENQNYVDPAIVQKIRQQRVAEAAQGLGLSLAPSVPTKDLPPLLQGKAGAAAGGAPASPVPASGTTGATVPSGKSATSAPTAGSSRTLPAGVAPAASGIATAPSVSNGTTATPMGGVPGFENRGQSQTVEPRSYTPMEAVLDAVKGKTVDAKSLQETLGRVYSPAPAGIVQGMTDAMTGTIGLARKVPAVAKDVAGWFKPDVEAARAGVDWAVNRPQTPASPEVSAFVGGIGQGLQALAPVASVANAPAASLSGWAANKLLDKAQPALDVASQIGRNFSRAVQGQPTYTDDGQVGGVPGFTETDATKKRQQAGY